MRARQVYGASTLLDFFLLVVQGSAAEYVQLVSPQGSTDVDMAAAEGSLDAEEKERMAMLGGIIQQKRRDWQSHIKGLTPPPSSTFQGRGVIVVGGLGHSVDREIHADDYTLDALLMIASLRRSGCTLPVELWHTHDPRLLGKKGEHAVKALAPVGAGVVKLVDFSQIPGSEGIQGYQTVPFAMLHSSFEEVLLLDADSILPADPTPLFSASVYTETGALFWPDLFKHSPRSPLWKVFGIIPKKMMTLETGQFLLNRRKHWKSLALNMHLNLNRDFYYHFSLGDGDLWTFSLLAFSSSFYVVNIPISQLGYVEGESFCGHTWLQFHPENPEMAVFAHRTLLKLSANINDFELRGTAIKKGRLPKDIPFAEWHPVSVQGQGDRPSQHADDSCKCYKSRSTLMTCQDMPSAIDRSAWANRTVDDLIAIEGEMLQLRSQLVDNSSAGAKFVKEWWRPLAKYITTTNVGTHQHSAEL